MEHIDFEYPNAQRRITNRAHVGVVGSGDMEVLFEPSAGARRTRFDYDQRERVPGRLEGRL